MNRLILDFFPLQHNESYIEQCVDLLNEEWPRSKSLRMRSLKPSQEILPVSCIMVVKETSQVKVIGHSRLRQIPSDPKAVFIESVIIAKKFRGLGLGRKLMQDTEDYAKTLGVLTCFLTTTDKMQFYERLKYGYTNPIQLYGCPVAKSLQSNKIVSSQFSCNNDNVSNTSSNSSSTSIPININLPISPPYLMNNNIPLPQPLLTNNNIPLPPPLPLHNNIPLPPPLPLHNNIPLPPPLPTYNNVPLPPPLPTLNKKSSINVSVIPSRKVYMKKVL